MLFMDLTGTKFSIFFCYKKKHLFFKMSFCRIVSRQKQMDFLTDSRETMLFMILSKVCPKSSLPPRFDDFFGEYIHIPVKEVQ